MFSPTAAERTPEDNVARATLIVVPFAAYTVTITVPQQLSVGGTTGTVLARVVDREGRPAPDGTKVYFSTDRGLVTPNLATTKGGVARVTFITGEKAGIAAVRAETQEERGATGYVRVVAAPAQTLDLVSARPWLHVGTDTAVLTATLRDAYLNPVVGEPILLQTSLGSFAGEGTVQSLVRGVTGPTGRFTATLISGVRTGTAMVNAQSGMLLKRLAIPFRPGAPAQVSIRLSRDQVTVHVPIQVTGLVQDVYGNPLAGIPVVFASEIGRLLSPTGVTDEAGAARTMLEADEPGFGTVSVTGGGQTAFSVLTVQQASVYLPLLQKPRQ
jgi:hypothetical protein